jgi:hypothetical protein
MKGLALELWRSFIEGIKNTSTIEIAFIIGAII